MTAARGADGRLRIALVNIDPDQNADVDLSVTAPARGRVSGQILTAAAIDSRNRFGQTEEVAPKPFQGARWRARHLAVAMPAKSIVVLTIP